MDSTISSRWFLGANTGRGFFSLYDGFASDEGDFLKIFKAGPGGGKSGYMRALGKSAEEKGLAVEYILCSGDPDSLDGVYIPALRLGYVDGTAPHVTEPAVFGASGCYLDLGRFADTAKTLGRREALTALTRQYQEMYARAYRLLSAAERSSLGRQGAYLLPEDIAEAEKRAHSLSSRLFSKSCGGTGRVTKRMVSAVSCQGRLLLGDTLTGLCSRVYAVDDRLGLAPYFLGALMREAVEHGYDVVACPRPSSPGKLEALLVPSLGMAWFADGREFELTFTPRRRIRLDAIPAVSREKELRDRLLCEAEVSAEQTDAAIAALSSAKAYHDELEKVYNPCVDFGALRADAEREIASWGL